MRKDSFGGAAFLAPKVTGATTAPCILASHSLHSHTHSPHNFLAAVDFVKETTIKSKIGSKDSSLQDFDTIMDKDQELKEQERAARAAAVSARLSVADSAALLDKRIAAQRVEDVADMDTKNKARASASNSSVRLEPAVRTKNDSPAMDARKKAAQDVFREKEAKASAKIGAAAGVQKDIRVEIAELESQATGKSEMSREERDALFKNQARNPMKVAATSGSSRTGLSDLEGEVASKSTTAGSAREIIVEARPPPRSIMANPQDDPALKKIQKDKSGAQSNRNQVLRGSSNPSSISGTQALRDLDERIAYKTGIAIDSNNVPEQAPPKKTPAESEDKKLIPSIDAKQERSSPGDSLSKLDGADAFEKALGRSTPRGSLSVLENKLDGIMADAPPEGYLDVEIGDDEDAANKLAVAVAVKEDEDGKFIPAAVEYDPDAKPPLFRNRRFRLYSLLACTLIAVMVAGVVGLLTQKAKEPIADLDAPTTAPTRPGSHGIVEQLELIVGSEVLNDPESPYYQAKEWLINNDPLQLSPVDANLVQRYLLAVMYFKLHEEGDWLSCNAPTEENPDDFCLFQKLINIIPLEYRSVAWYRWLSGNHECSWAGISCDEFYQLRSIDLTGQEIRGELPIEFSYFPFLQGFSLAWNQIHGTIPSEYGNMPHLLNFEVHYNMLTGTIPPELSRAENLQMFNIAANEISGSFPDTFFDMTNIKGLFVYENLMTGTFPSELSRLSLLNYVRLHRNFFTGTIPTELGLLNLRELWIHRMPLEGPIPSEFGNMEDLVDLRLYGTSVNGTIPEEIWQLTNLWRLDLFDTQITGTLSSEVAQLTDLAYLRLRNADMTGTLPDVLSNMTELVKVWFDGNEFIGSVPDGICEQPALLDLVADCLPSSDTNEPKVACSCCHICCDHATGLCDENA